MRCLKRLWAYTCVAPNTLRTNNQCICRTLRICRFRAPTVVLESYTPIPIEPRRSLTIGILMPKKKARAMTPKSITKIMTTMAAAFSRTLVQFMKCSPLRLA